MWILVKTAVLCTALSCAAPSESHWPQFRGEGARGIGDTPARSEWNVETGDGIAWKTSIDGLAHSSPVVWGNRLFVTTAVRAKGPAELSSLYGSPGYGAGESVKDEGEIVYRVLCLDKRTGEVLWTRDAHTGVPKVQRHPKSSHANPTPACDAQRIVVSFGSEGVYCYDHNGRLEWKRDLGVFDVGAPGYGKEGYQWGVASSPALHGGLVILQCDHEGESFLTALDAATGKDVWRTEREEDSTWCTPTVHAMSASGKPQVIVNGYKHIGGYALESGEEIWSLSGGGDVPVPTPVVVDERIFLTSAHGRSRPIRALRSDASGRLSGDADEDEALLWVQPRRGIYMQTPIAYEGRLYCCSDGGILGCYDVETGVEIYRERIGDGGAGFSGSAVIAGDRLYLSSESGEIYVLATGDEPTVISVNDVGETCMATPAMSEGWLYLRTRGHVIAIAPPPTTPGEADDDESR